MKLPGWLADKSRPLVTTIAIASLRAPRIQMVVLAKTEVPIMSAPRSSYLLGSLLSALVLSACGGGGGSSGSGDSGTDNSTTSTTTVSGMVERTSGSSLSDAGWLQYGQRQLAGFISPVHADVAGLEAADGEVPVALVRLARDGTVVETLAQTETDGTGRYRLESSSELSSSTFVRVGNGSDALRAPAVGVGSDVSPITEAVVAEALAQVSDGNAALDDYTPKELAAAARATGDRADQKGIDLSQASVANAVANVRSSLRSTIGQNLTAALQDSAGEFAGDKHLLRVSTKRGVRALTEAQVSFSSSYSEAEVTESGKLVMPGKPNEIETIERKWFLDDSVTDVFDSSAQRNASSPQTELPLLLRDDLTFTSFADGNDLRGVRSAQGELLSFTDVGQLAIGASPRSNTSPDFRESFNAVALRFDADESDRASESNRASESSEFRPGQVGVGVRTRATIDLICNSAVCDITIDEEFTDPPRAFFTQSGPSQDLHSGSLTSSFLRAFTVPEVSLNNDGSLEDESEFNLSGFVGPDDTDGNPTLVALGLSGLGPEEAGASGFPYASMYLGVPAGENCSNATLDGTYEMVDYRAEHEQLIDSGKEIASGSRALTVETVVTDQGEDAIQPTGLYQHVEALSVVADDQGSSTAALLRSSSPTSSEELTYNVASNCVVTVADQTGGTEPTVAIGAVSPDGETFLLGAFDEKTSSAVASMFVGFRR